MRRRDLTGSLHVALEVPELLQADARDIDNVCAQGDGGVVEVAVLQLRREGLVEAGEVLVEGEQAQQALRGLAVPLGLAEGLLAGLLVGGDGLGVEVLDLEEVQRDAAAVAAAGPLRVQAAALLVGVELDGVVEGVDVAAGAPLLRVLELREGVCGGPAAGSEVSPIGGGRQSAFRVSRYIRRKEKN